MAKAMMVMPDDFLEKLARLGDKTEDITKEVLKAGGKVVSDEVKSKLHDVIGEGIKEPSRSTGQLESALGVSPPMMDNDGNWNVKVGFAENRTDGEVNAKIANVIEYGKHGQPAKPFLARAKRAAKKPCEAAMKEKFEEEISKL